MYRYIKTLLVCVFACFSFAMPVAAQINTDQVMIIGRNALYFEDYILSIQYFNQVIKAKPYLAEPYFSGSSQILFGRLSWSGKGL